MTLFLANPVPSPSTLFTAMMAGTSIVLIYQMAVIENDSGFGTDDKVRQARMIHRKP